MINIKPDRRGHECLLINKRGPSYVKFFVEAGYLRTFTWV